MSHGVPATVTGGGGGAGCGGGGASEDVDGGGASEDVLGGGVSDDGAGDADDGACDADVEAWTTGGAAASVLSPREHPVATSNAVATTRRTRMSEPPDRCVKR
jgi:hypothetical protein